MSSNRNSPKIFVPSLLTCGRLASFPGLQPAPGGPGWAHMAPLLRFCFTCFGVERDTELMAYASLKSRSNKHRVLEQIRRGASMSEKIVAVLLTFGLLGGMFFWVPLLELVCPPCSRLLRRRQDRALKESPASPVEIGKVA